MTTKKKQMTKIEKKASIVCSRVSGGGSKEHDFFSLRAYDIDTNDLLLDARLSVEAFADMMSGRINSRNPAIVIEYITDETTS